MCTVRQKEVRYGSPKAGEIYTVQAIQKTERKERTSDMEQEVDMAWLATRKVGISLSNAVNMLTNGVIIDNSYSRY